MPINIIKCRVEVELYKYTREWVDDDGVQHYILNQIGHRILPGEPVIQGKEKSDPLKANNGDEDNHAQIKRLSIQVSEFNRMKLKMLYQKPLGIHTMVIQKISSDDQITIHC